ncbi:serine/threonine-protein kinase [Nonomuraea sp. NPDC049309]|uniref:serine/threonine-protein kinase n=1 Tax=Nonomuraea sp. NPDC049309 TaxID=3364350 RepID=UPI003714780E
MEPTGAAPLRPTDLREIGPYRLLGRLGEGGMGTVFLAKAPTGRFVAVKVVKAAYADQEGFAARFHAEVENARRVASFCTAQVLGNGTTADGRPYMVTEYISGTPLSAQIANHGALDPGPLHGVALGVAAALAAIHVAGLVHRDLKPANVILSISGPRVIDFGIARALDRETGFTLSGELLGSPGWWAPEQVRGEPVSPAADIFAWGCLVAYAGNGRHPFGRGDPVTLAHRVLNTPPDLGALPAPLNDLVRRATSMDPALRPSAQDLLIALVGGTPATAAAPADPPTLVATEMLGEWEPPRNVLDEADATAAFPTPPPRAAAGAPPGGGARPTVPPASFGAAASDARSGQASAGERARQEEVAARREPGVPRPGRKSGTETLPGTPPPLAPADEPDTLDGTRTPGTRRLIAAAAAVAAIVVTVAVLVATSGRDTAVTANPGAPSQVAGSGRPDDVGRRFALGPGFDDPVAIVPEAPQCGLRTYQDMTATKGQLCVIRWTMINPSGTRRKLIRPVVTMVDDRGAEHGAAAFALPPAIPPGGRLDSAFVFDLAPYRKPVKMTAAMLRDGRQIEVALG